MKPDTGTQGGAVFDPSGRYRYRLWRRLSPDGECVAFIMLNPSTADAVRDDPTIRRCIGFARAWGFSSLVVVNLFAYRTADPRQLRQVADPVGPDNDRHLLSVVGLAGTVVAGWGNAGALLDRDRVVRELLGDQVLCLGITGRGQPRHPLYARADSPLVSLRGRISGSRLSVSPGLLSSHSSLKLESEAVESVNWSRRRGTG